MRVAKSERVMLNVCYARYVIRGGYKFSRAISIPTSLFSITPNSKIYIPSFSFLSPPNGNFYHFFFLQIQQTQVTTVDPPPSVLIFFLVRYFAFEMIEVKKDGIEMDNHKDGTGIFLTTIKNVSM